MAKVSVKIAGDRLSATLTMAVPAEGEPITSNDELKEILARNGVVYGIDETGLEGAKLDPGKPVVVAHGDPPREGVAAKLEWVVEPGSAKLRPEQVDDGRVDYRDLNLIRQVDKDRILARKIPSTQGIPGTGVDGKPVPGRPGRDVLLPRGKNIYHSPDGLEARAAIKGHFTTQGSTFAVLPIFEHSADVDFSTGNIDFPGNVKIRGSVGNGFTVRAGGDIEVGGAVNGGRLEAGGNILVGRGIQGAHRGGAHAEGTITARFIENAEVHAGKDVIVADAILHCQIDAGGKVVVAGKPGVIVGGVVRAATEVSGSIIGAPLATATEIQVGVNPRLREEMKLAAENLARVSKELERAETATRMLKGLQEKGKVVPFAQQDTLLRLARSRMELQREAGELRGTLDKLEEEIATLKGGRVRAREKVYPGVRVVIGQALRVIEDDMGPTLLLLSPEGEVILGTI